MPRGHLANPIPISRANELMTLREFARQLLGYELPAWMIQDERILSGLREKRNAFRIGRQLGKSSMVENFFRLYGGDHP